MPQYLCRHVLMSTKRIRSKISVNKTMTLYFVLKLKSTIKAKLFVLVLCCHPQSLWYQSHGFWSTFNFISEYISACYTQFFSWWTNSYGRCNSSPSSHVSLGLLIVLLLDHHQQSLYVMVMRFQARKFGVSQMGEEGSTGHGVVVQLSRKRIFALYLGPLLCSWGLVQSWK